MGGNRWRAKISRWSEFKVKDGVQIKKTKKGCVVEPVGTALNVLEEFDEWGEEMMLGEIEGEGEKDEREGHV